MSINTQCDDVTVIVCTKNVETTIEKTIRSILSNKPGEVIVVDADSTDNTRSILEKYRVKILSDPGRGLAWARQIGIEAATKRFIFFMGDDNVIAKNSLSKLKRYLIEHQWVGAGMLTRIKEYRYNYWTYGSNARWKLRMHEGECEVVGTPYMFYAELLKEFAYDINIGPADDADIEKRILDSNSGYKIGYSDIICYDYAKTNFKEICSRFAMYGKSDYLYWKKYSGEWGIKRKIQSIMHPLRDEFWRPMKKADLADKIICAPFFLIITTVRYVSWIICAKNKYEI